MIDRTDVKFVIGIEGSFVFLLVYMWTSIERIKNNLENFPKYFHCFRVLPT